MSGQLAEEEPYLGRGSSEVLSVQPMISCPKESRDGDMDIMDTRPFFAATAALRTTRGSPYVCMSVRLF